MTRIFTSFLFVLLALVWYDLQAQTTISTNLTATTTTSAGGVTFVITNTNAYPIKLTNVGYYVSTSDNGQLYTLYYSSTSLSGPQPTTWPAANWSLVGSATVSGVTTTGIQNIINGLTFNIPANTTYRFSLLKGTIIPLYASSSTSNTFSAAGVNLHLGNYQINGLNVGYAYTITPRYWCGSITFETAVANNVSAIGILSPASNATFCYNEPVTVTARIQNKGSAPQSNFPVGAYYSSPAGSGNLNTLYTGTLAPGQIDTVVVGTFTPFASTYTLAAYTNMVNDSLRSDDTAQGLNFTMQGQVPLPNAVSDTVCAGMDAVVKVSSSNQNATFKWYSAIMGGTQLSTSDSILFAALPADTTMYVATVLGNCESDRVPISAAIGPPPVVNLGPDTSFCESIPLVLDAGNPGGTYRWSHGDSLQTTSISTVSGTYWVVVDKYCTVSDTIDVTIRPMPQGFWEMER